MNVQENSVFAVLFMKDMVILGNISDLGPLVIEAIDKIEVSRIDHGVQSMKDSEWINRLCNMNPKIFINACIKCIMRFIRISF